VLHTRMAAIKNDVVEMMKPAKVGRVALRKTGPRYEGLVEVDGRLRRFSLSGDGFFVREANESQERLWDEFEKLEDAEERG